MASIKDLLKYKDEVPLKNKKGTTIKTVWVRLLGEEDINKASKLARIASTKMRAALRDPKSQEYQDQIEPVAELDKENLIGIVVGARQNRFTQEAYVKIDREELPTIEEVAEEPDAPSLEDQESLDVLLMKQQQEYEKKIDEFIEARVTELKAELSAKTSEELLTEARLEMSNILPLQTFFDEMTSQKIFRGTYEDKLCKVRSFETVDDFKDSEQSIKEQLIVAYT